MTRKPNRMIWLPILGMIGTCSLFFLGISGGDDTALPWGRTCLDRFPDQKVCEDLAPDACALYADFGTAPFNTCEAFCAQFALECVEAAQCVDSDPCKPVGEMSCETPAFQAICTCG